MSWEKILGRSRFQVVQGIYRRDFPQEAQVHAGSFVMRLGLGCREDGASGGSDSAECPNGFVVLEHDEFLDYALGKRDQSWRQAMVLGSYVLWTIALILMIIRGFREKTYGMPVVGSAGMLAMCFIAGYIGPWVQPHLFVPVGSSTILLWTWRFWFWVMALVYVQYLLYSRSRKHWLLIGLSTLAGILFIAWTFVIFYQDYYVNELSPLVVFMTAAFYFVEFRAGDEMRGMTPTIAWLLAVGTALLYVQVVLGDMKDAYPFKHSGYDFIYLTYSLTLILMFVYAWIVTERSKHGNQETSGESGA